MSQKNDLINQRFGRLLVLREVPRNETKRLSFECICDCGNFKIVASKELRNGHTKSCGCIKKELISKRNKENAIHGKSKERIYKIWCGIKDRCLNENTKDYCNYGGKGVNICDRWKNSFQLFYEDMGEPPTKKHQIDRIDPLGNYEPFNCRWVTPQQNSYNKSKSRKSKNKYKGVVKVKENKFIAQVTKNKKYYYLGTFVSEKEAAKAYNDKAKELFGEYACLNNLTK